MTLAGGSAARRHNGACHCAAFDKPISSSSGRLVYRYLCDFTSTFKPSISLYALLLPGAKGAASAPAPAADAGYPAAGHVIAYFCSRHPRLCGGAEAGGALPLPPGTFAALIAFLRACRQEAAAGQQEAEDLAAYAGADLPDQSATEHTYGRARRLRACPPEGGRRKEEGGQQGEHDLAAYARMSGVHILEYTFWRTHFRSTHFWSTHFSWQVAQ